MTFITDWHVDRLFATFGTKGVSRNVICAWPLPKIEVFLGRATFLFCYINLSVTLNISLLTCKLIKEINEVLALAIYDLNRISEPINTRIISWSNNKVMDSIMTCSFYYTLRLKHLHKTFEKQIYTVRNSYNAGRRD